MASYGRLRDIYGNEYFIASSHGTLADDGVLAFHGEADALRFLGAVAADDGGREALCRLYHDRHFGDRIAVDVPHVLESLAAQLVNGDLTVERVGDVSFGTVASSAATPTDPTKRRAMSARAEKRDVVITYDDGTEDVRSGGTRAWRNNNPGNLRNSKFSQAHGSLGEAGGFAVFPDEVTGFDALLALLRTDTYQKLSIEDAIKRYAPPSENDTAAYERNIRRLTGLDTTKTLNTLSAGELEKVARAIRTIEGWSAGTVTTRGAPR